MGPSTRRNAGLAIVLAIGMVASACSASPRSHRSSGSALAAGPAAGSRVPPAPRTASTVPPPTTAPLPPLPRPGSLKPLVSPALSGEGTWHAAPGSAVPGGPAIYTTQLRPAAGYPASGVAWIDTAATRLVLYAGTSEPYGTWPQQGSVAAALQPKLLAAFNSGFKIYSYRTGWYDLGRTAMPLQPGAASLVTFSDGSATVGQWGRDVSLTSNVVSVRQNLTLLVDNGAPAANATDVPAWGSTLGHVTYTWRSAVGVTRAGDLVYVAGPSLDPALLARLLIAAGAVRAMELDINPEWVSLADYVHSRGAISAEYNLLPGMYHSPGIFVRSDSRDFLSVFTR